MTKSLGLWRQPAYEVYSACKLLIYHHQVCDSACTRWSLMPLYRDVFERCRSYNFRTTNSRQWDSFIYIHARAYTWFVVLHDISQLLNTQLDKETLATCVSMIESGVNPEALAVSATGYEARKIGRSDIWTQAVIQELRRESAALNAQVGVNGRWNTISSWTVIGNFGKKFTWVVESITQLPLLGRLNYY